MDMFSDFTHKYSNMFICDTHAWMVVVGGHVRVGGIVNIEVDPTCYSNIMQSRCLELNTIVPRLVSLFAVSFLSRQLFKILNSLNKISHCSDSFLHKRCT